MIEEAVEMISTFRKGGAQSAYDVASTHIRDKASREYARLRYEPAAPECYLMSEDWDNLIILDACRYDQFERLNSISGRLEARSSLASATPQVLSANFKGTSQADTVYVTANPMYRTVGLSEVFHDVVDVWLSEWSEDHKTVLPEKVTGAALEAYKQYPNKRLIVHFMQPHHPFICDNFGSSINTTGYEKNRGQILGDNTAEDETTVWDLLEAGEIDKETVWEAYDENLELVLPHVEKLVTEMKERTIVTSDHGNLVGERIAPFGRPMYGHPFNVYTEELLTVPWLVIEGDRRKEVHNKGTQCAANGQDNIVSERLADLGYTE